MVTRRISFSRHNAGICVCVCVYVDRSKITCFPGNTESEALTICTRVILAEALRIDEMQECIRYVRYRHNAVRDT